MDELPARSTAHHNAICCLNVSQLQARSTTRHNSHLNILPIPKGMAATQWSPFPFTLAPTLLDLR